MNYMQQTSNDPRSGLPRSFIPDFEMCPSMHACSEVYDKYVFLILRMGAFYTKFKITTPEVLIFPVNLSLPFTLLSFSSLRTVTGMIRVSREQKANVPRGVLLYREILASQRDIVENIYLSSGIILAF